MKLFNRTRPNLEQLIISDSTNVGIIKEIL